MSLDDDELSLRQDIEDAIIQASDCVNDSTKWWDIEEKGPRLIETLVGMIVVAAKEHSKAISKHEAAKAAIRLDVKEHERMMEHRFDAWFNRASKNIGPDGITTGDLRDAFEAGYEMGH